MVCIVPALHSFPVKTLLLFLIAPEYLGDLILSADNSAYRLVNQTLKGSLRGKNMVHKENSGHAGNTAKKA